MFLRSLRPEPFSASCRNPSGALKTDLVGPASVQAGPQSSSGAGRSRIRLVEGEAESAESCSVDRRKDHLYERRFGL